MKFDYFVNTVAFSDDKELIAIGGERDEAVILDFVTMTSVVIKGHTSFLTSSVFINLEELEQTRKKVLE